LGLNKIGGGFDDKKSSANPSNDLEEGEILVSPPPLRTGTGDGDDVVGLFLPVVVLAATDTVVGLWATPAATAPIGDGGGAGIAF
jgi:hypothetical protein